MKYNLTPAKLAFGWFITGILWIVCVQGIFGLHLPVFDWIALTSTTVVLYLVTNKFKKQIEESNDRVRRLAEVAQEGIIIHTDGDIVDTNQSFLDLVGFKRNAVLGQTFEKYFHEDDLPNVLHRIRNKIEGKYEAKMVNADGDVFFAEINARNIVIDGQPMRVASFTDISDRKAKQDKIEYLAHYDELTGLPKRSLVFDRLEQAIKKGKRNDIRFAFMVIDLDKFKPVNDTYGHSVGDLLLKSVSDRLKHTLREEDTIGRFGGDEFIAIVSDLSSGKNDYYSSQSEATKIAEKITNSLNEPFNILGNTIEIGCSVGFVIYPDDGTDRKELFDQADENMYKVKTNKTIQAGT